MGIEEVSSHKLLFKILLGEVKFFVLYRKHNYFPAIANHDLCQ
jgi:hypothetical protein